MDQVHPLFGLFDSFVAQSLPLTAALGRIQGLPSAKPLFFSQDLPLLRRRTAKWSDMDGIWGFEALVDATLSTIDGLRQPSLVFSRLLVRATFLCRAASSNFGMGW